jgi:ribosomal protein S10
MRSFNLLLTTKTKYSLKKFLHFFSTNIAANFNFILKNISKKKRKVVITILKSPHVNKTAQEQFEIKLFSEQLKISTTQMYKFLIFFKRVTIVFADINFKIKFLADKKKHELVNKKILNIDNFKSIFFFENNIFIRNKKLNKTKKKYNKTELNNCLNSKNILKIMDLYGSPILV